MKPSADGFAVVTASTNLDRAHDCLANWRDRARYQFPIYVLLNAPDSVDQMAQAQHLDRNVVVLGLREYKGVVPAFALGVEVALRAGKAIIACLHDDLLLEQDNWDAEVIDAFMDRPRMGLCGFGGGVGLGDSAIYQKAYAPYQLARQGFTSNMRDAEAHGSRSLQPVQVAALDGFSQIGRAAFWQYLTPAAHPDAGKHPRNNLFAQMADWGVTHHFYDGMLGCFARRLGWECWMIPISCHHHGGRTAVADTGYTEWAKGQDPGGDQGFWEAAHRIGYEQFRDVLPIRVK